MISSVGIFLGGKAANGSDILRTSGEQRELTRGRWMAV